MTDFFEAGEHTKSPKLTQGFRDAITDAVIQFLLVTNEMRHFLRDKIWLL